jgi:hypothetical protein
LLSVSAFEIGVCKKNKKSGRLIVLNRQTRYYNRNKKKRFSSAVYAQSCMIRLLESDCGSKSLSKNLII